MKIRIKTQRYDKWREDIRNRAEEGEWETWSVVKIKSIYNPKVTYRRLIHVPGDDHQYEDIQLMLNTPTKDEAKQGEGYLDIIPKLRRGANMEDDELHAKSAVVLGRFCEVLNRYFPSLRSYTVILK